MGRQERMIVSEQNQSAYASGPSRYARVAKPAHVPDDLVFDFDPTSVSPQSDPHRIWKNIQNIAPPIFWNPHGGHWVVTRAPDIKTVQVDHARFSHAPFSRGLAGGLKPISLDPPAHTPIRAMFMPVFMPKAIKVLEDHARAITIELIEAIKPRGGCEFVSEFADIVPMEVFLNMVGLPSTDREMLIAWVRDALHGRDTSANSDSMKTLRHYLAEKLEERRAAPGTDLLSVIVTHEIDGQKFTAEDCLSIATLMLLGGLDTVASMLGFVARALATHPEIRRRIQAEPKIMPVAIEELLRRHGLSNTMRLVTQDFDFQGAPFRKGDLVQQAGSLYGLDDDLVDNPLQLDLDRETPIPHAVFGNGPHVCPGQMLARREIKVFLEEWLTRIPDFEIRPGTQPQMKFPGLITMKRLELSWDVPA
jgi:cytochrome P450